MIISTKAWDRAGIELATPGSAVVKVFLLSEREISPNYTGIFLHFVHGFGAYVKGLPKTKRCNSVAVTVLVRFRFGFGVYVKQP